MLIDYYVVVDVHLNKARKHKAVHPKYAGAIGYCFGAFCATPVFVMRLRPGCVCRWTVRFGNAS